MTANTSTAAEVTSTHLAGHEDAHAEITDQILAERAFLSRLARRLVRSGADIDDLVQETTLRAYKARDRFTPGTSMRAWLATILRRLFLTGAIRDKRRKTHTDTDLGDPLGRVREASSPPSHLAFEQVLERVDDKVKRSFKRLPEVYRTPFVLFALGGLSYAEIAERLSIPPGTVMSRIHRARQRLRSGINGSGVGSSLGV